MPTLLPVTLRDLNSIYWLEQDIFPKDAYPRFDLAMLLLMPGMVNLKIIAENRDLIGFVSGAKAWLPWNPAWIVTLGVAKAYQHQGYGRQLLLACETKMRQKRVHLTVRKSNASAIALYESSGYSMVKNHRYYYPDGEDGLIMEKKPIYREP